ncbi:MAG: hypothetical protein ABIC95_01190 [archaeon]
MDTEEKNQPEKRFLAGPISASVWVNKVTRDGHEGEYRSVTLQRAYKDKNDQWQHTSSLRVNDLPRASLVLDKAYEFIVLSEAQN